MLELFNNRELASILLFSLFIIYIIYKIDDRHSLGVQTYDLFLQFFQKRFLLIQLYFIVYIFIEVIILNRYFYWNTSFLKDTIIWMIPAYFLIINHSKQVDKKHFLRRILLDNLKFIAIYEFMVNLYTFNFLFEFIMTTVITFLILIQTVMQYQKEKVDIRLLEKIINIILLSFSVIVIYLTIDSLYDNYQNIVMLDQVKKFFLPFLLMLFYLPFYYLLIVIIKYESIFVIIDLYQNNDWLKVYTKVKIIISCSMNYEKLKKVNLRVFFLSKLDSKKEVKLMINDIINDKFNSEKYNKW